MACKHHNFTANIQVGRIVETEDEQLDSNAEIKVFMADVSVTCSDCGVKMLFTGVEQGVNFNYPTVDIAGNTIHLPMIPENKGRPINLNVN